MWPKSVQSRHRLDKLQMYVEHEQPLNSLKSNQKVMLPWMVYLCTGAVVFFIFVGSDSCKPGGKASFCSLSDRHSNPKIEGVHERSSVAILHMITVPSSHRQP